MRRKNAPGRQPNGSARFDLRDADNFAIREFTTIDTRTVRFQLEPMAWRKSKRAFPADVDVIEMSERHMLHVSIQFES